ncbi:MAG: hypothetical protein V3U98_08055 [Acidobacteriota bacterium]
MVKPERLRRRKPPFLRASVCLALLLAAAGADLFHRHALGRESDRELAQQPHRCTPADRHSWTEARPETAAPASADPCLVCRSQRSLLHPGDSFAAFGALPAVHDRLRSLMVPLPSGLHCLGFLDRAPPALNG